MNYISSNNFGEYKSKLFDKISNYYINKPKDNISDNINNDHLISSEIRKQLSKKLELFEKALNKQIFFLSGGKGIGKTITFLGKYFYRNIFYFNIKIIKSLKSNDRKKIIYTEFMHLFINIIKIYQIFKVFQVIYGNYLILFVIIYQIIKKLKILLLL